MKTDVFVNAICSQSSCHRESIEQTRECALELISTFAIKSNKKACNKNSMAIRFS